MNQHERDLGIPFYEFVAKGELTLCQGIEGNHRLDI